MSRAVAVLAGLLLLGGCGGPPPAPEAGALPLAPRTREIASAAGGSQVDATHDHNRYRYVAVGGPARASGPNLIATQVQWLLSHGWNRMRSIGFRGTATTPRPVPVTSAGAEVLLDSPDGKQYAAIQLLSARTARQQTSRTPLARDAAIETALRHRRPVLWVVLGNGRHS